ncbi:hypothetical protein Droror1_Dr00019806 [Drosera rotundifolia]
MDETHTNIQIPPSIYKNSMHSKITEISLIPTSHLQRSSSLLFPQIKGLTLISQISTSTRMTTTIEARDNEAYEDELVDYKEEEERAPDSVVANDNGGAVRSSTKFILEWLMFGRTFNCEG